MSAAAPSPAAELSLFSIRPFMCFVLARSFSTLAYQMITVAVGWQLYTMTGKALDLGLLGLVQFLPSIVLMLVVGHVADRYDRRIVLGACLVVHTITATLLALGSFEGMSWTGWIDARLIFMQMFFFGATRSFEGPTSQAIAPNLVPLEVLPRAIAFSQSAFKAAAVTGPALGGFLYLAGPVTVYTVCAIFYGLAFVMVTCIRMVRIAPRPEPISLRSIFAGMALIRRRPVMLGAVSLDLFAVLLGGATALLPIYAQDILHIGPEGLGLLRSAPAMGALPMALLLSRYPLGGRIGRTMLLSVAVFGLATIVFALSTSFVLSLAALVILGASDMVSVVIRVSLIQLQTPDNMRGRVSAVASVFIGTSNELGEFESGMLAALIGAVGAALFGGVGTLLVVLLWIKLFPELARFDRLRTP